MTEIDFSQRLSRAAGKPELPETSREFVRTDPIGYGASRRRLLEAAILDWDEEQILSIVKERAYLTDPESAIFWFFDRWWQLREQLIGENF